MRQKSVYFQSLYRQYKKKSLRAEGRHELYERMVKNAEHFAEWAIVYQLGDNKYRYDALENMKNTVYDEQRSSDVQMNILELFELVTDETEQENILKKYLSRFNGKDDLLFVMAMSSISSEVYWEAQNKAISLDYYKGLGTLHNAVEKKDEKLKNRLSNSPFMKYLD